MDLSQLARRISYNTLRRREYLLQTLEQELAWLEVKGYLNIPCPACGGTGFNIKTLVFYDTYEQDTEDCRACGGSGVQK